MDVAGSDIVASAIPFMHGQKYKKCFETHWKIKKIQTNPEFQAEIIQSFYFFIRYIEGQYKTLWRQQQAKLLSLLC